MAVARPQDRTNFGFGTSQKIAATQQLQQLGSIRERRVEGVDRLTAHIGLGGCWVIAMKQADAGLTNPSRRAQIFGWVDTTLCLHLEKKQQILETSDVVVRLEMMLDLMKAGPPPT